MAVLKNGTNTGENNLFVFGTVGGLLCLTFSLLGIKFRWFKERLSFEETPRRVSHSRRSYDEISEAPQILRATFRASSEFDSNIEIVRPKTLPPVRIHNGLKNKMAPLPPRLSRSISDNDAILKSNVTEVEPLINSNQRTDVVGDRNQTNHIDSGRSKQIHIELERDDNISDTAPPLPSSPPPLEEMHDKNFNIFAIPSLPVTPTEQTVAKPRPPPPPYNEVDPLKIESRNIDQIDVFEPALVPEAILPPPRHKNRKNAFLHQVETPKEIPVLRQSTSIPDVAVRETTPTDTIPSSSTFQSSMELNKNQVSVNNTNKKSGFFGFLSSSKNDKQPLSREPSPTPQTKIVRIKVLKQPKDDNKDKKDKKFEEKKRKEEEIIRQQMLADAEKHRQKRLLEAAKKKDKTDGTKTQEDTDITIIKKERKAKSKQTESKKEEKAKFKRQIEEDRLRRKIEAANLKKSDQPSTSTSASTEVSPTILRNKVIKNARAVEQNNYILNSIDHHSALEESQIPTPKASPRKGPKNVQIIVPSPPKETLHKEYNDTLTINVTPSPRPSPKKITFKLDPEIENKQKSNDASSDTEIDTWDIIDKHRQNTKHLVAIKPTIGVHKNQRASPSGSSTELEKLDMIQRPKTMREMRKEKEQSKEEKQFKLNGKDDISDTEA